ncbi:MAG: hypothetical protein H0T84_11950 [Tatlockia sp.]|nr:hypothetical protein [Tatlockia sp.]
MKAKEINDQKIPTIVKRSKVSLKTLTENYENYLLTFMVLKDDPLSHIKLIEGQIYLSKKATELALAIYNDLESSLDRIENLVPKNTVCNKSLILHFKINYLFACYTDNFGKNKTAFNLYFSAYEFIKTYGERLYKDDDPGFHKQIYQLIVFFSTLSSIKEEDNEAVRLILSEVMPHLIAFTVKCCAHQYYTNLTNYLRVQALKKPLPKSEQLKLGLKIESNLQYSSSVIVSLHENGHYNNDFLLLHISIMILHGEFALHINEKEDAILSYLKAFYFLKGNLSILEFKSNFDFQDQIYRLFERLRTFEETEINDIYPELELLETSFLKKCGISIVIVEKSYEKFMKLLWRSQAPLLNERRDFFSKATQLNNSYQNLKILNRLPFEYQLYSLAINYYMLNLSIATQPRRLFNVLYLGKITMYFINKPQLNVGTLNSYLGSWSILKKLYSEPSIDLIKGRDMSEFVNINSLRYYLNFLKYWSSLYSAIMILIKTLIDREFKNLEQVQKINDKVQQEIMKLIFKLEPEIHFLMKTAELIGKADREINEKIGLKELKDEVTIPYQVKNMRVQFEELNSKIGSLKTKLKELNEQCKKSQDKLIEAEEEQKKRKPTKKQRKQIPIQEYAVEEISSDEDSTTEEEHCPINPSLGMLQAIDIELTNRVKKLKPELTKFFVYLEERLKHEIPLPGDEHTKAFSSCTELTLQSYELDQLFTQYKALAQLSTIKSLWEQQRGIKINQSEHYRAINDIAAELAKITKLYDKVNFKHIDGKLNKIYKYGLIKIKEKHPNFDINKCGFEQIKLQDPNFKIYQYELEQDKLLYPDKIYKRIMKLGRIEFIQVGKEKVNKGEQLSQYSNQNEFLASVSLVFTSLGYLHEKLKTNPITSSDHSFFNLEKKTKICAGRFQGAIGLLYKNKYQLTGDLNCLYNSIIHLDKSFIYYENRTGSDCILADLSFHLAVVKEELAIKHSENSNLKNEILVHYQAALEFNAQLKTSSLEEKKMLEINTRIDALKNNSGNLIQISY